VGDTLSQQVPLHAAEAVATGSIPRRAFDALSELLTGWLRKPASS
jgi:D-alanyl-D-alanine carboxypeptidase (penicillin-binding protein 5/6)